MKRILALIIISSAIFTQVEGQDKAVMSRYQDTLTDLFDEVYNAPTDNERYHANETAVQTLARALAQEESIKFHWNFGTKVSVLTARH